VGVEVGIASRYEFISKNKSGFKVLLLLLFYFISVSFFLPAVFGPRGSTRGFSAIAIIVAGGKVFLACTISRGKVCCKGCGGVVVVVVVDFLVKKASLKGCAASEVV